MQAGEVLISGSQDISRQETGHCCAWEWLYWTFIFVNDTPEKGNWNWCWMWVPCRGVVLWDTSGKAVQEMVNATWLRFIMNISPATLIFFSLLPLSLLLFFWGMCNSVWSWPMILTSSFYCSSSGYQDFQKCILLSSLLCLAFLCSPLILTTVL